MDKIKKLLIALQILVLRAINTTVLYFGSNVNILLFTQKYVANANNYE